jgi:AcrR family transcriptional regulator
VPRADLPLTTPKSRRRRIELLAAAQTTFERLGYFDTRVADIAAAAGVSHGTFYTHFKSKDDVLHTLVETLADDLFDAATTTVEVARTPLAALEQSIRTFMHAYRDRAAMIRVLDQALAGSDEFLRQRQQIRIRFQVRLEEVLRSRISLDPALTAIALGGMVEDFARGCYVLGLPADEEAAIATLTAIWARAIGLPEAV